jgi:hypothetical protein
MVGPGASLDGRLFLGGTDGSNPAPSSGESMSRAILPSHGEKAAFRAGDRPRRCSAVSRDGYRAVHGADRREYLCQAKFQYRGVDAAVA